MCSAPKEAFELVEEKVNALKEANVDQIEKSSDLIYKYGMENLSNKEQKSIERNIRNIWQ